MARRSSALAARQVGHFGAVKDGFTGVQLSVIEELSLLQLAAWPDTLAAVGQRAAAAAGAVSAPAPGTACVGNAATLLRVEPLKWWLISSANAPLALPELAPEQGCGLDLSHSRCWVRLAGDSAATLLNRFLPLDLRASSFAVNQVAASAFHHVGVTLWRSADGFELLLPRGFALSLWQLLLEGGEQFGIEVR